MKKIIDELEKLSRELKSEHEQMVREVKQGGLEAEKGKKLSEDGFAQAMVAVHRMHTALSAIPAKLSQIADRLRVVSADGKGN